MKRKKYYAEHVNPNRFIRYNESILVELPPENSEKKFMIVYFLDKGLQYSYGNKDYPFWLIDICDIEEVEPHVFCVHDLFIDIQVNEDLSYQLLDLDDFYFACKNQVMNEETSLKALQSLSVVLNELNTKSFPNLLNNLIKQFL